MVWFMWDGKRRFKTKQYLIWFKLLIKRLLRQPAYLGLIVLIPILGYAVSVMEQGEAGGIVAAVCVEEGAWSGQIADGLRGQEKDSVITFKFCVDEDETKQSVMKGEADCGFVIPADIDELVSDGGWRKSITVYETSGSSITGMAKERIGGVIFQLYSEQCYENYMGQISEEIVDFAKDAYESHLVDESTFGFRYISSDRYSQYNSDTNDINDTAVFPIKGVFAVMIFIGGMCGMLEYDRDKREKRFLRMAPNVLTFMVNVWVSTLLISVAVLVCLWISDGISSCGGRISIGAILSAWNVGMWLSQIGRLIVYQCIIVIYCGILGILFRKQEAIAAAIPILSLGSLVCAPVFIRLAAYLPVFAVLEKLFPVTYYLMM